MVGNSEQSCRPTTPNLAGGKRKQAYTQARDELAENATFQAQRKRSMLGMSWYGPTWFLRQNEIYGSTLRKPLYMDRTYYPAFSTAAYAAYLNAPTWDVWVVDQAGHPLCRHQSV